MAAVDESVLLDRARRAYERGRVLSGARLAACSLPLVALALTACPRPAVCLGIGAAAAALVALFVWRGRDWARGARAGLLAGVAPLLCPVVVGLSGHPCAEQACLLGPGACVAGGLAGGLLLWRLARGASRDFVPAALLVAAAVGSMGCLVAGLTGILGMALSLAGTAPLLLRSRAR